MDFNLISQLERALNINALKTVNILLDSMNELTKHDRHMIMKILPGLIT